MNNKNQTPTIGWTNGINGTRPQRDSPARQPAARPEPHCTIARKEMQCCEAVGSEPATRNQGKKERKKKKGRRAVGQSQGLSRASARPLPSLFGAPPKIGRQGPPHSFPPSRAAAPRLPGRPLLLCRRDLTRLFWARQLRFGPNNWWAAHDASDLSLVLLWCLADCAFPPKRLGTCSSRTTIRWLFGTNSAVSQWLSKRGSAKGPVRLFCSLLRRT